MDNNQYCLEQEAEAIDTKTLDAWLIKNSSLMEELSTTQIGAWLESNCAPQCWDDCD